MSDKGLNLSQLEELKRWLIDAPHVEDGGPTFCEAFANFMRASGLPLWRVSYTLTTMHPEVLWRTMMWNDTDGVKIVDRSHAQLSQAMYTTSPIPPLIAGGAPIRVALATEAERYPVCVELKAMGGSDYFAQGLPFSWGGHGYISWATQQSGGWDAETIETLTALAPFLARRIELESSYHATAALLGVYLGRNAARRVIEGSFKRGQGERIHSVIWFCDMRGFTSLSDTAEAESVVAILDTYFDIVATAIAAHDGEVLKFIGDAVLAIFPVERGAANAWSQALKAADEALLGIDGFNRERKKTGAIEIGIGIGLHIGEVMYGNVGAKARLDFTVISSAVNEASRLESLCKELGTALTLSEAFVQSSGSASFVDLGLKTLKGVKTPLRVFTLERLKP